MKYTKQLILFIVINLLGISTNAQKSSKHILELTSEYHQTCIIQHVNIFDGLDSTIGLDKDVLIENGVISKIQNGGSLTNDNAFFIDGTGQTLLPGFIDAHVHLTGSGAVPWEKERAQVYHNLKAYVSAGVTTVYDMGGLASKLGKIKDETASGKVLGPDIYHTHIPVTVRNSHPIPLSALMLPWPLNKMINGISPTIDESRDADKIVKDYIKKKVDYMKISCDQIPPGSPEMSLEQMTQITNISHDKGLVVFAHIGSPQNAVNACKAKTDVLAHGIWRGQLTGAQADLIAESGVKVVYTIAGFQNVDRINRGVFEPSELDKKLVHNCVLHPVTGTNGLDVKDQEVMNVFFADVSDNAKYWQDNFNLLQDRAVPIAVGTDSQLPGTYAGSTYHQEIKALRELGMSNYQVLHAATYLNAHLFIKNPNFGQISQGMLANLLLVKGNPLEDLNTVFHPTMIMKRGRVLNQ